MLWNSEILRILALHAQSDPALMQAAQRFMPVPPVLQQQQALQAGGQLHTPLQQNQNIGPQLAAAANKDLSRPFQTRSDWQTIGHLLGKGEM